MFPCPPRTLKPPGPAIEVGGRLPFVVIVDPSEYVTVVLPVAALKFVPVTLIDAAR